MDSGSQQITFFALLLVKPRKLLIFAPLNGKIPCGCGVIGSRARLRIWCREACRFESYHPHTHTVFYRQKPTKTAILVGFLLLIPRHYEKKGLSGNIWLVSFKISYLCLPLFYETRTTPSCHPSGCAYRQL